MALNQKIELSPIEQQCNEFCKDVLEQAKQKTVRELLAAPSAAEREILHQRYLAYEELMGAVNTEVCKRLMDRYNPHR
jgi:hypothetical protein